MSKGDLRMAKRTNRVAWGLEAILAAVVLGTASPAFAQGPFRVVPGGHPAEAAVNELAKQGLINGYADGTYDGNQAMTRYEVAMVFMRILDYPRHVDFVRFVWPSKPPPSPPFTDVPKEHWAADAVQEAHDWGLLLGRADGTFAGDRVMSRAEFAAALQRLHIYLIRFWELNQQHPPKGR
jgi:hypothetical protein